MSRMSKMATLELQRKGALDLADALYNENKRLKEQIEVLIPRKEPEKKLSDEELQDIAHRS